MSMSIKQVVKMLIFNTPKEIVLNRILNSKLIIFDLDGTLTTVPSVWRIIHQRLNVLDKAKRNYELFYKRKITYNKWAQLDGILWKGVTISELNRILDDIKLRDGAEKLLKLVKKQGYKLALISGGIDLLANRFWNLGFDFIISNKVVISGDVLTGEIDVKVDYNKEVIARDLCKKMKIDLDQVIAIGDSDSDLTLFQSVGVAIGINPEKSIYKFVDIILNDETLYPLLELFQLKDSNRNGYF